MDRKVLFFQKKNTAYAALNYVTSVLFMFQLAE